MPAFGDESGNFRNLLSGNEPYFVLAVAAGERTACGACAGRTIRLSDSMKEAKWNDLVDVEKRRFLESVSDRSVQVAYAVAERSDFDRMRHSYALYDETRMHVRPTSFVTGAMYAALLLSFEESVRTFEFDKVWSDDISAAVVDVLNEVGTSFDATPVISSQSKGVQTADCAAGAVREHALSGGWQSALRDWSDESEYALATVEKWLSEYRK
jgi:hypothetical protein